MTPAGKAQLRADEGQSLTAYPDPDSELGQLLARRGVSLPKFRAFAGWATLKGDPWTVGVGCTGAGIGPDTAWTQAEVDAAFDQRIEQAETRLAADKPWFTGLDPVRQDVLVNIAFNVGVIGLERWPTTLGHFQNHNFAAAAADLLAEGPWNREVGARANRLSRATLSGAWPNQQVA